MSTSKIICLPIGGQPVAVARLQAAKSLPLGKPVPTFGRMIQVCALGNHTPVLVGRIGGVNPPGASRRFC